MRWTSPGQPAHCTDSEDLPQCPSLWPLGSCNNRRPDRINCQGFSVLRRCD